MSTSPIVTHQHSIPPSEKNANVQEESYLITFLFDLEKYSFQYLDPTSVIPFTDPNDHLKNKLKSVIHNRDFLRLIGQYCRKIKFFKNRKIDDQSNFSWEEEFRMKHDDTSWNWWHGSFIFSDFQNHKPKKLYGSLKLIGKEGIHQSIYVTQRELDVLQLLSNGFSAKEIGKRLTISTHRVTSHKKQLMLKFDAHNAAELIKKAFHYIRLR